MRWVLFTLIYLSVKWKKKKSEKSTFIHNLAYGRMATAILCLFFYLLVLIAEKKSRAQFKRRSFHVPNLIPNTYLGRPKWYKFEVDSDVEVN